MSPINRTDSEFSFVPGSPPITADGQYPPSPPAPTPGQPAELGPLGALVGEWEGEGFNTIWRPHFPSAESDRFLELNLTTEKLVFSSIGGEIPNRGLLQKDIAMFGVTYLQQISTRGEPNKGLHIEPGIWAVVPQTTDPTEPSSVVRMASIPHGTAINAQGTVSVSNGPPAIAENNIIPFGTGGTPPSNSNFSSAEAEFTQLNLATQNLFREIANGTAQNGIDQAMVETRTRCSHRRLQPHPPPSRKRRPWLSRRTMHRSQAAARRTPPFCKGATRMQASSRRRSGSRRSRTVGCNSNTHRR